jgi:hypothetical protein
MKIAFIIAGAAAFAIAAPAAAKPGNGHGHDHGDRQGWDHRGAYGNCPPGLAKKHNGCMAPGQARKLYRGQHYQSGYGDYYSYGRIPYDVRRRYDLNSRYRYYYDNGTLYAVDPRTMLIQQVISALLR